ncbi:MAG: hypothetical protein WCF65_05230 [Parachlamydiaceae bacterium]
MSKSSCVSLLSGVLLLAISLTACSERQPSNVVDETYIHKYGVSVPSDYWKKSGEDGTVVRTMTDGVIVSSNYSAGKLDGETKSTYPHSSQIQKSEIYQQGAVVKVTEFFFDGTPKNETAYNTPEAGVNTVSAWYLNGTPRIIEQYRDDRLINGQYFTSLNQRDAVVEDSQGTRFMRDDYGHLLSTDTIQDGQLSLRITYFPTGSPRETISYRNGVVEGTKRTFNPSGDPCTVEQWSAGAQNGLTTIYQHGEKCGEATYVNGDKQGEEIRYRDGRTVVQKTGWEAGKMHGPSTTYIGEVVKTDWYYKGNLTTKGDFEYMTGKSAVVH